jgi:hypothetical protein
MVREGRKNPLSRFIRIFGIAKTPKVEFGLSHPAVFGVNFQPAFRSKEGYKLALA